jgi:hypothetical protein
MSSYCIWKHNILIYLKHTVSVIYVLIFYLTSLKPAAVTVTLHYVFMCSVWFSLQTVIISLNSVNKLMFVLDEFRL